MRKENEEEVFQMASEAKAHLNSLEGELDETKNEHHIRTIRHNLEIIERRSDPAVGR